jgi:tRNA-specific 2-thiouridylase
MKKNKKVGVLMSGGIDSSFAALYLKEKGFDVFGITFLQIGKKAQKKEIERVKKIAKELKINYFLFDIKKTFKEKIIDPFVFGYQRGITPSPCPFCNKEIKFNFLLKKARKAGADYIATGHYVRRKEITADNLRLTTYELLRAKDKKKDQSYFLWQLTQKELRYTLFPLGDFKKAEVFNKVKKSKIGKFFKEKDYNESQDICFLKNTDSKKFLREKVKKRVGPILDKNGKKIGEHEGICFFTIGQRSGIKIGAKSPNQKPLYVIDIKAEKNAIVVGEEKDLYKKELFAKNINWISGKAPKLPINVKAKIRSRAKLAFATIKKYSKNTLKIEFKKPQRAITPGQHIVFYQKDILLGGGVIER